KAEKPPSASSARTPKETKPIPEKPSSQREDFAPSSPGAGPVNLDAVMRSLRDLITHELNVSNESQSAETKPAATHDEYLEREEDIEEYIPEELSSLDKELEISDQSISEETETSPPPEEAQAPETNENITAPENLMPPDEELTIEAPVESEAPPAPQEEALELSGEVTPESEESTVEADTEEFIPLDEELTFEAPLKPEARPALLAESTELPGEISPDLLKEPISAPPAGEAFPTELGKALAPGEQHEMSFGEVPSPALEPDSVSMDSAPVPSSELELAPEPPAPLEENEPSMEAKQEEAVEALPTIDVEESFDNSNYFTAAPPPEHTPPPSEETIDLSVEISSELQTDTPPVEETTATPEPEQPSEAPTEAGGKKIVLEIVDEPVPEKAYDKYTVDFDSSDLSPPLLEEPELSPPAASPAAESETPVDTTEGDSPPTPEPEPEPEPETTAPAPEAPALEAKTETPPTTEPPDVTGETLAPTSPASHELDDIPVLKDVVAQPGDNKRRKPTATPAMESPLPAPDRAREIVVRAVAKLNVEMRKSGSAGLDTRTILRLQQLIRQELERSGKK
ncbi:MAG TPA: hypothetical protein VIR61_00005, partial [Sulfuricaulis sp.]